jgi:hypothetical protein
MPSGPEGIRTPGLLSAIEARSQLRYRPGCKGKWILLDGRVDVKYRYGFTNISNIQMARNTADFGTQTALISS